MIIGHLLNGPQYYGELLANLEPISKKVLTQNLRELEEMMIVSKEIHQQNKIIKVQYSLTKVGHSLKALLNDLMEWGVDYSRYYKNNVVKEQKNG
ncbi:MAG: helix-turn-helix transcriptional regulator [Erysipelotrichaceae bacterium]|nr:helix-turn-helix transcriptional regulator [Erysipelotrichaceae bacterium]